MKLSPEDNRVVARALRDRAVMLDATIDQFPDNPSVPQWRFQAARCREIAKLFSIESIEES